MIQVLATHQFVAVFSFIGLTLVVTAFLLFFNRDPVRVPPKGDIILSPADGKIIDLAIKKEWEIIAIFMNPFNVHVQRAPYAGKVIAIKKGEGPSVASFKPEATRNQRVITTIATKIGNIVVKQITGIFVRRIKTFVKVGESIKTGQRFGKITLGSRVELWLPTGKVDIKVKIGDKVLAGITVVALPK